jgi:hypothetical protein
MGKEVETVGYALGFIEGYLRRSRAVKSRRRTASRVPKRHSIIF